MKKIKIAKILHFVCAFLWVIIAYLNFCNGNTFMMGVSITLFVAYFCLGIVYHRKAKKLQ